MRRLYRVIDFETTGTPTEEDGHAICEIGWSDVVVQPGGTVMAPTLPRSLLINPNRPMPVEAMAVHHIRDEDLVDAAPLVEGFGLLREGIDPETCVYVAHQADFERSFFSGRETPWICTYKAALRIWPEAPNHKNQLLRYYLGLELVAEHAFPPHRAGPDAYVTAGILARMLQGGADPNELIRWSTGPALLPRVGFGQYRGSKWEDLTTDYLEWIVDKSSLDRDAKANAKYHLRKRREA